MKKALCIVLFTVIATSFACAAAADEIKIYNNGGCLELSRSAVWADDRIMAPVADLFEARGWRTSYDADSETVRAYDRWGACVTVTANNPKVSRRTMYGEDEVFEFDPAPSVIDGSVYMSVRSFYEQLYGYRVEWDEEEQTVKTSMYNIDLPVTISSEDETCEMTIDSFELLRVEDSVYKDSYEIRFRFGGKRVRGLPGGVYAHLYDRDGVYLKTMYLSLKDHTTRTDFMYYSYFYVPKSADTIVFTLDRVTPEGERAIYWN